MKLNTIKCQALEVKTDSGACVGVAKTKQGEEYLLDGRTPEANGMCANAFCAFSNAAFIMMTTEDKLSGKDGYIDRFCPHGNVVFRLSRTNDEKSTQYNTK